MTIETTAIITGVFILLIGTVILAIAKHLANSDKHPCKKDIVFKDVCASEMTGLKDCFESEVKSVNTRLEDLKVDVKNGFDDIKDLLKT